MQSVNVNVRFYETDLMGIAHHSNHFRWFEMARIEYMRCLGITLQDMMDDGIVFPILDVQCHYIDPARFDDTLRIDTYLVKLTRAQMVFKYRMYRDDDGTLLATGETKNAFTSKETGRIMRLDDTYYKPLVAAVEAFPDES